MPVPIEPGRWWEPSAPRSSAVATRWSLRRRCNRGISGSSPRGFDRTRFLTRSRVASNADRFGGVLVSRPFGQAVGHVHDTLAVEYVTGRPERFGHLARLSEIEQRRKRDPHAAAFVGDGRAAARAAH